MRWITPTNLILIGIILVKQRLEIQGNVISYPDPSGMELKGHSRKHVKFRRDVDDLELPPEEYVSKQVSAGKDLLFSGLGLNFKHVGQFESTREKIYLTVVVPIPDIIGILDSLENLDLYQKVASCNLGILPFNNARIMINRICKNHQDTMKSLKKTVNRILTMSYARLDIIQKYIPKLARDRKRKLKPQPGKPTRNRPKRIVDLYATSMASANRADIEKLKKLKPIIENLEDFQVNITEQVEVLTKVTENEFKTVYKNLNVTYNRLNNLTHAVKIGFEEVRDDLNRARTEREIINLVDEISTIHDTLQRTILETFFQLKWYLQDISEGIHELELGQLPALLVPHDQLADILQKTARTLFKTYNDYELITNDPIPYYRQSNVIYVALDYKLVIRIPVYIKEKHQEIMQLYQAISFHVPYSVYDANHPVKDLPRTPSYTKIILTYEYVAVGIKQYVLLHGNQLRECIYFNTILVCESIVLQRQKTDESCLGTIFSDITIEKVAKLCNFNYYYNLNVVPQTFTDDKYILIANVNSSWSLFCLHDTVPRKVGRDTYAVVNRDTLCHCKIVIADRFYIQQRINNCGNTASTDLDITYPINSLVMWNLRDIIDEAHAEFNYFSSQKIIENVTIPYLKVEKLLDTSQIILEPSENMVEFEKIRKSLNSTKLHYLRTSDLLWDEYNKAPGFDLPDLNLPSLNLPKLFGISIGPIVIGVICVIIVCCVCCRQQQNNAVARTISLGMTALAPGLAPTAQGAPTCPPEFRAEHPNTVVENAFIDKSLLLTLTIFTYVIYILGKKCYKKYLAFRVMMPGARKSKQKVHVYVEIITQLARERLHLVAVPASMINITFYKSTTVQLVDSTVTCTQTILHLSYKHGSFKLFDEFTCTLPTLLNVPFSLRKSVNSMLKDKCYLRMLLYDDTFYQLQPLFHPEANSHPKIKKQARKLRKAIQKQKAKGFETDNIVLDIANKVLEQPEEDVVQPESSQNLTEESK